MSSNNTVYGVAFATTMSAAALVLLAEAHLAPTHPDTSLGPALNLDAVPSWIDTKHPLEISGTHKSGDGGQRRMNYSSFPCGTGGNSVADGATCINSGVIRGSWNIDKATPLTPELFSILAEDATPAFQALATAACNIQNGGVVHLAAKVYKFSGTSSIIYACPIIWEGSGWSETPLSGGTWLQIQPTGSLATGGRPLFSITSPSARGTGWSRIGIVQAQPVPSLGWTARAYPPVFSLNGIAGGASVSSIIADPVYDLISAIGSGRLEVCGLYGQVLHRGLFIDEAFDTNHGSCGPIHWWPYWSQDENVLGWAQNNAVGISLGRVDGAVFPDLFLYGFKHGVEFISSPNWTANLARYASKIWFGNYYADAVVNPIYLSGSYAPAPYYEPYGIAFANVSMSCAAVGTNKFNATATGAAKDSAGILIERNAAIDLAIGNWNIESCDRAPLLATNVTFGSTLRFGSIYSHNQRNSLFQIPSVTQTQTYNISVSQPPLTDGTGAGDLWATSNSNANVVIAREKQAVVNAYTNSTYFWPGNTEIMALRQPGAASAISGITVHLPPNPWGGMVVTIFAETAIKSMTLLSRYSIQGPPIRNLAQLTKQAFIFSAADNSWLPFN